MTNTKTYVNPGKKGGYDIVLKDNRPFNSSGLATLLHELVHALDRNDGTEIHGTSDRGDWPALEDKPRDVTNEYRALAGEELMPAH